jgi:hypothetical protein
LTTASQAVLAGGFDPPDGLNGYILDMLYHWKKPDSINNLGVTDMTLTLTQYRNFWNKANKNVSCYSSALSFSTMKLALLTMTSAT